MEERNWPPRLYLAVDCGGSKAAAAICDEDCHVVGKGRGGPSNFTDEGLNSFLLSVEDAIRDALDSVRQYYASKFIRWQWKGDDREQFKQESTQGDNHEMVTSISDALRALRPNCIKVQAPNVKIEAAWFGIAGVDSPADVTTLTPHLAKLLDIPFPSERLIVANDTSLLASPITDSSRPGIQSGVVVIAGTGSIVMSFKRSRNGMLKVLGRVGGFGWVLGDEGSGYSVGRNAVRKVLDIADRERLAREGKDTDSESDVDNDADSCSDTGINRDMEIMSGGMSNKACSSSGDVNIKSISKTSRDQEDTTAEARDDAQTFSQGSTMAKARYGQMLRDRILQDWGLLSTDELLRAVYFEDVPPSTSRMAFGEVPTVVRSGPLSSKTITLSEPTLKRTNSISITQASSPSLNLLPPTGHKLDEETRNRRFSPIPSLSSSPSDSINTAISPDYRQRHNSTSHQSDSAVTTEDSSVASSFSSPDPSFPRTTSDRKHRLASLAPLVFHLAFTHDDELCLEILKSQAHLIALQICDILQPSSRAKAHLSSHSSVLCLGGGLVGQQRYRSLLLEELSKLQIVFSAVEYVADPATRGAMALSSVQEQRAEHVH